VSTITIAQGSGSFVYTFVAPVAQIVTLTTLAGSDYTTVGTSDYFDIYTKGNEKAIRVVFKAGTSVSPDLTGFIGVEVDVDGTESADDIALELYEHLIAFNEFNITPPTNNEVVIVN
jgi:hypothetical protein